MTPEQAISMLDRHLAANGEDIILSRLIGTSWIPVTCRAAVQPYQPQELIQGSGIFQGDLKVILSPSRITAAGWPGTPRPAGQPDPMIPIKGDRFNVGGRIVTAQAPAAVRRIDGKIVRMECQCRG